MARRPRLLAPGVLYHVIVRGNQRQKTFLADTDYQAYLERLGRYRQRLDVIVVTVPGLVLLKIVSYLSRPEERARDLLDIVYYFEQYESAVGKADGSIIALELKWMVNRSPLRRLELFYLG